MIRKQVRSVLKRGCWRFHFFGSIAVAGEEEAVRLLHFFWQFHFLPGQESEQARETH